MQPAAAGNDRCISPTPDAEFRLTRVPRAQAPTLRNTRHGAAGPAAAVVRSLGFSRQDLHLARIKAHSLTGRITQTLLSHAFRFVKLKRQRDPANNFPDACLASIDAPGVLRYAETSVPGPAIARPQRG